MRITCPNCAAEYDVPDTLLAGGRALRCKRCGTEFRAGGAVEPVIEPAPAPIPANAQPAPPAPTPPDPEPPSANLERRVSLVGWIASLIVLAAAAVLAITYHAEIVAAWPPAARLFGAFGLN